MLSIRVKFETKLIMINKRVDLNRRWKNPDKILHPEIYYTKKMILDFNSSNEI